jgi:hypothetical protein
MKEKLIRLIPLGVYMRFRIYHYVRTYVAASNGKKSYL